MAVRTGESRALVGRNGAGKSTLVGVLTGLVKPDSGRVAFSERPAPPLSAPARWHRHVACVYQRPTIVPDLSVAENLFLNRQPTRRGIVAWAQMHELAEERLIAWGVRLDVSRLVRDLAVDERQIVEIIRALEAGPRLIILDEPTAQLEGREIHRLFDRIRTLQSAGVTFIYISHHLHEIYEICHSVTVLRDGAIAREGPLSEMDEEAVISAMVGQEARPGAGAPAPEAPPTGAETRLELEQLTLGGSFCDVDLSVRRGECVGIAGLVGSGKKELAETIAGLRRADRGSVKVDGRPVPPGKPGRAIAAGVGYVPEDRYESGFVPGLSVAENLTMSVARSLGRAGWISSAREARAAGALIDSLSIKAIPQQAISELSGGNQQKAVLGRALATEPSVVVMVHPTAGVDIASKDVIFQVIRRARTQGKAVLIASDDMDELRTCDRVVVMFDGQIRSQVHRGWDRDALVSAIEGVEQHG